MSFRRDLYAGPDTRHSFSFGTRLGLTFIAEMATVSALMVGILLAIMVVKGCQMRAKRQWPPGILLFFLSLLVADMIQAIGAIMDIRWIHWAGVLEGPYCTAQGVLKQIGDVGVALSSLSIAVQTFGIIVLRWSRPKTPFLSLVTIGFIWFFIGLLNAIGVAKYHTKLYGNTGLWCTNVHTGTIIGLEYAWLWLSALASIVLYIPVAMVLYKKHHMPEDSTHGRGEEKAKVRKENLGLALQMLFYPVIYCITILPQSVIRLIQFVHPNDAHIIPLWAATLAAVFFGSSGALNVVLYSYTRPSLLPSKEEEEGSELNAGKDIEDVMPMEPPVALHHRYPMRTAGYEEDRPFNPYRSLDSDSPRGGLGALPD